MARMCGKNIAFYLDGVSFPQTFKPTDQAKGFHRANMEKGLRKAIGYTAKVRLIHAPGRYFDKIHSAITFFQKELFSVNSNNI